MRQRLMAAGLALGAIASAQPAAAEDAAARRLVGSFLAAYDEARTFSGTIRVVTRQGDKRSDMRMALALEKPNLTSFTILEAPGKPLAIGTKIVWYGTPKAQVKTRFFGIPLKLEVPYDDQRLRGVRGDTMLDMSIVTAVAMVRDPGATFRYLGPGEHRGRQVDRLEMRSPRMLAGIDREVFAMDRATAIPLVREMYDGGEVVYRLTVEDFVLDRRLPPETFRVD